MKKCKQKPIKRQSGWGKLGQLAVHGLLLCGFLFSGATAQAISIGRIQALALLDRPLDARITLSLTSSESAERLCPSAEVFSADVRVAATAQVVASSSANAQSALVRVRTSAALTEPIATLVLTVGCDSPVSRRFTLLVEPAPEEAQTQPAAQASAVVPAVSAAGSAAFPPNATSNPAGVSTMASAGGLASGAVHARPAQNPPASDAKAVKTRPRPSALRDLTGEPRPGQSRSAPNRSPRVDRLVMDAIDLREPTAAGTLKSSVVLGSMPTADTSQRAALTALWRSLQRAPEEQVRQGVAFEQLSADVKALRAASQQQSAAIAATQATLSKRETAAAWWLLGLAAVAVLFAGLAAYLFYRNRSSDASAPWWRADDNSQANTKSRRGFSDSDYDANAGVAALREKARRSAASKGAKRQMDAEYEEAQMGAARAHGNADSDNSGADTARVPLHTADSVGDSDSGLANKGERPKRAAPTPAAKAARGKRLVPDSFFSSAWNEGEGASAANRPAFSLSIPMGDRALSADEVIDISQQVEFFESLGQIDQAIALLRDHMSLATDTPPLHYVELLRLYFKQNMRSEFDVLRAEFLEMFNAIVPTFDVFELDTAGLDSHPQALDRITALWPSPKVLRVIEESLMRKPDDVQKPFNYAAYQDLLFLHSLLKDELTSGSAPVATVKRSIPEQQAQPDFEPTKIRTLNSTARTRAPVRPDFGGSLVTEPSPLSASVRPTEDTTMPLRAMPVKPVLPVLTLLVNEERAWPSDLPRASPNLGIDIDLGALPEAAVTEPPPIPAEPATAPLSVQTAQPSTFSPSPSPSTLDAGLTFAEFDLPAQLALSAQPAPKKLGAYDAKA